MDSQLHQPMSGRSPLALLKLISEFKARMNLRVEFCTDSKNDGDMKFIFQEAFEGRQLKNPAVGMFIRCGQADDFRQLLKIRQIWKVYVFAAVSKLKIGRPSAFE